MLNSSSGLGPTFKDPLVEVKILAPMWIGGVQFAEGDTTKIAKSDAQALKNSTPPRVEII
ncbi:MAG: hypothetical protein WB440_13305 [Steroidobacteraceae bacterium]|jgi:hypothetical protein